MNVLINLTGKEVGNLRVLKFSHIEKQGTRKTSGMSYYLCECKACGKRAVLARSQINSKRSKFKRCTRHSDIWFKPGNYFD